MKFKYELGDILKDKVTGFTGVVMVRAEYFTGCIHYGLCPRKVGKNGTIPEWEWVDVSRLVKAKGKVILSQSTSKKAVRTSGPMPSGPEM